LRVPIQTNSAKAIAALVDGQGTTMAEELCAGGYTPLGGTLAAARQYFSGTPSNLPFQSGTVMPPTTGDTKLACRPLAVILLTDGAECCTGCQGSWSGCPDAHDNVGISCQTNSCTTIAGTCPSPGGHFESAPERAYELLAETNVPSSEGSKAKSIKTYVIGFGINAGNQLTENIAIAGDTDAPGPNRAFYPTGENDLAAAFSQIIADAQPPAETCNNADDDCDGNIDEGIPKFCDKPNGVDDKTLCDEPDETKCDGEDDDCDGLIDEGVLNACGQCGKVPGEICDGDDNDCDGSVDEDTDGGECGVDKGMCSKGTLRCIGGEEECTGGVNPGDELCNCKDDDCDGTVDEDVDPSNPLCEGGRCVGCECLDFCTPNEEFMPQCPDKLTADIQPNGECLCIEDNCDAKACRAMSITHDDEVACAPDSSDVAACSCKAGSCVALCDGVTCPNDGEICNPKTGRCVEDNCRGLGCKSGQLCDPLKVECTSDPCATAGCDASETCRDGACEKSCVDVGCDDGQKCHAGACVEDKCAAADCGSGEVCVPDSGECKANPCAGKTCDKGLSCSIASGECERDACWNIHCPTDARCVGGECVSRRPSSIGDDGDDDGNGGKTGGGTSAADPNQRLLAAGGGGCACRVTPGAGEGGHGVGMTAALLVLGLAALRARRRGVAPGRRALWLALPWLIALLALSGCSVKPFCLDCTENGGVAGSGSGGASNAGSGGQTEPSDAQVTLPQDGAVPVEDAEVPEDAGVDGSVKPVCENKQRETCNGKDDDCDFKVDEDTEAEVNDCNQNGVCAGSKPTCVNGAFVCLDPPQKEDDETLCDGKDSDCDGRVDETFKDLGEDCTVGVGACQVTGENVCNAGGNGLTCKVDKKIDPEDEACDGVDNDCDGLIDEPRSAPGDAPSFVHDDVVQVQSGLWIFRFEAARADATDEKQGVIGNRACSREGVLPWTSVTFDEAKAACAAADMELCAASEWVAACQGGKSCSWSWKGDMCPTNDVVGPTGYPNDASPTNKKACNGHDLSAAPGGADNDELAPAGTFGTCFSEVAGGEKVWDLSGNAKEWVVGGNESDANQPVRGGSYNDLPGGLLCDSTFGAAPKSVRLPNLGFRCCSDKDPSQP
jgi:MYXO-CTERM domain-containing protein